MCFIWHLSNFKAIFFIYFLFSKILNSDRKAFICKIIKNIVSFLTFKPFGEFWASNFISLQYFPLGIIFHVEFQRQWTDLDRLNKNKEKASHFHFARGIKGGTGSLVTITKGYPSVYVLHLFFLNNISRLVNNESLGRIQIEVFIVCNHI